MPISKTDGTVSWPNFVERHDDIEQGASPAMLLDVNERAGVFVPQKLDYFRRELADAKAAPNMGSAEWCLKQKGLMDNLQALANVTSGAAQLFFMTAGTSFTAAAMLGTIGLAQDPVDNVELSISAILITMAPISVFAGGGMSHLTAELNRLYGNAAGMYENAGCQQTLEKAAAAEKQESNVAKREQVAPIAMEPMVFESTPVQAGAMAAFGAGFKKLIARVAPEIAVLSSFMVAIKPDLVADKEPDGVPLI